MIKKPLPTIGVDRYTFFKMLTDEESGATYDEAYSLRGTTEISPTDSGGSDVFDADNGAYVTDIYLENLGHNITNADIPPEVDAMWRGTEQKNGMVTVGKDTKTVHFAVAWRILKSDRSYRYVKYYKGAYSFASNVGGQTKPSSGAPNKQTAQATYTAVARDYDGNYYAYMDEADIPTGMTREQFEEQWFSDPNYSPEAVSTTAKTTSTTKKAAE